MTQFSGVIGRYNYYDMKDIQQLILPLQRGENYALDEVFDIIALLKKYAYKLAEYELRYEDDGK